MKKPTEKDISKLKNQRRLNVQEQNLLRKNSIIEKSQIWKNSKIKHQLSVFLLGNGIEIKKSIFLEFIEEYFGGNTIEGVILSQNRMFYSFEIELNEERNEITNINSFENITNKFEIEENKKGIKKSIGFIANEILNELNTE